MAYSYGSMADHAAELGRKCRDMVRLEDELYHLEEANEEIVRVKREMHTLDQEIDALMAYMYGQDTTPGTTTTNPPPSPP